MAKYVSKTVSCREILMVNPDDNKKNHLQNYVFDALKNNASIPQSKSSKKHSVDHKNQPA